MLDRLWPVPRRKRTEPEAERVVLTDPRALRALAHPARTAVIDELYQGNVRTASELAELTGLTPSAMSYHLRALEKWGIVRRAERTGDARERPWRRCAPELRWEDEAAPPASQDAITGLYLERLRRDLSAAHAAHSELPPEWANTTTVSRGFPWLTLAEAQAANQAISDIIAGARARTPDDHPPDARRVAYFWAVVPLVDDACEP